jgi:iron(III) transport system ATP-binding protein
MRNAIRTLQNTMGITTIYVTHDQEEAMAVSDRLAVMNTGVIQQVGTPKSIYQRPANLFVANFIGRSNTLHAQLDFGANTPSLVFENGTRLAYPYIRTSVTQTQPVMVSVRPEEFIISRQSNAETDGLPGEIISNVFLGLNTTYFIRLFSGDIVETVEESSIDHILSRGTAVTLRLKLDKVNIFRADGLKSLTSGGDCDA